jgi:hypothetical protein
MPSPNRIRQILAVQQLCGLEDIQFEIMIIPLIPGDTDIHSTENDLLGE